MRRKLVISYQYLHCMYAVLRLTVKLQWMATKAGLRGIWS